MKDTINNNFLTLINSEEVPHILAHLTTKMIVYHISTHKHSFNVIGTGQRVYKTTKALALGHSQNEIISYTYIKALYSKIYWADPKYNIRLYLL
jgi:hypothetical protein